MRATATWILATVLAPPVGLAAPDPAFWAAAATSGRAQAARLSGEAAALSVTDLAASEGRLRAALVLRPHDEAVGLALAELEARRGRAAAALAVLEGVVGHSADAVDPAVWLRIAGLRVKLGRHAAAAAAYEATLASGAAAADLYTNLAEMLMAEGRLGEAEARYRDAIAAAAAEITGERRPRSQDLALAYYGLGVALDRDDQGPAAREMIARALALDPGASLLKIASSGGGDLFFAPDGDVYYYLGLAAEAEGRPVDAEAAFREFVARRPGDRWAREAAGHLAPPQPNSASAGRGGGRGAERTRRARVVAFGTVEAAGGIAAPLVDAAWRAQVGLLDDCLERAAGQGSVRISIEVTFDRRGRVIRSGVKAAALGESFARCAEAAIKERLTVVGPPRPKITSVRTDLIIAFP